MEDLYLCYFCDRKRISVLINNYQDINYCEDCSYTIEPKYINNELTECSICFENKKLIKLPNCNHCICLVCCKTIYFGNTTVNKPKNLDELYDECPDFPYNYDLEDNAEYNDKYNKYLEYEKWDLMFDQLIDYKTMDYNEILIIRDNIKNNRPSWMNIEEFIEYENKRFNYFIEFEKLDNKWELYDKNKIKGNSSCPLCRS